MVLGQHRPVALGYSCLGAHPRISVLDEVIYRLPLPSDEVVLSLLGLDALTSRSPEVHPRLEGTVAYPGAVKTCRRQK